MTISEKSIPSCKFEYTIKHWNGGYLSDSSSVIREKFLNTVNEWGQEGWEIVQVFTSTNEKCLLGVPFPAKVGVLLKRKIDETSIV